MMSESLLDWKNGGNYFSFKGMNIFYRLIGAGKPILLLHGYPYNSFDWHLFVSENNQNQFQWILLDLPGMGFSDKPKNHIYSFEEYSELIVNFLQYLKIPNVSIFSHDLGVSVVQELLAQKEIENLNLKIESLLFMNGGLFSDVYKPRLIQRILSQSPQFIGKLLSILLPRKKIEESITTLFGPNTKPNKQLWNDFWNILNFNEGKKIAYLLGRLVFEKPRYQNRWISAMKNTKIPLCYICGPFDPNSGIPMANRFKSTLPNSKLYLLSEEIGHWPQIEAPKLVFAAVQDFLNEKT